MTNLKTIFKQKSKLLLIVLSLLGMLFSYSCSCRNNSTAPGGGDNGGNGGGKFTVSEAKDNIKNAIVKSSTSGEGLIKVSLSASHGYDFSITVNDEGTEEKITAEDFTKNPDGLTAKGSLADKVKKWTTDNGPATRTITITFTVAADDTTLQNATQNVSVDIKLTHAKLINDDNIEAYLKKGDKIDFGHTSSGPGDTTTSAIFDPSTKGTYNKVGSIFKIDVSDGATHKEYYKGKFKTYTEYYLTKQYDMTSGGTLTKEDDTSEANTYSLTYDNIIYKDDYESTLTKIVFKFVGVSGCSWTETE